MTTQVIFKIDKKLKDKAMKKAQQQGIAFSYVLKLAIESYIRGDLSIRLIAQSKLNKK